MKTKMKHILGVAALLLGLNATVQNAKAIDTPIYAGQNILVGDVIAFATQTTVYIYAYIDPAWDVSAIHFQPVSSYSEFPVNNKQNPKIGNFLYTEFNFTIIDLFGDKYYYMEIPRSSLPNPASPTVCAAFHAVVSPKAGSGIKSGSQTAWAAGTQFNPSGSWASYFCVPAGGIQDE